VTSVDELWRPIYNAFDPWRPLFGEELKLYFVPRTDLLPENNPLDGMRVEFMESRLPLKVLLTGHRESGWPEVLRSRSAGMVASAALALSKLGRADEGIIQTLARLLRGRKGPLARFFGPRLDEDVSVGFRSAPAYDFVFEALWEMVGRTAD